MPLVLSIYDLHSKVRGRELAKLLGSGGLLPQLKDFEGRHYIHNDALGQVLWREKLSVGCLLGGSQ